MLNFRHVSASCLLAVVAMMGIGLAGNPAIAKPLASSTTNELKPTNELDNFAIAQTSFAQSGSAPAASQRLKVFFPKNPGQQKNLSYVEPVWRQTSNPGVAQFAIEQVITGPTNQEKKQGFLSPIRLQGASNCGKDFTLSISAGVARLKFCKQVISGGIGDDARATSSINATLKQFPTVRSVIILNRDGSCFGDMSGENRCLRRS